MTSILGNASVFKFCFKKSKISPIPKMLVITNFLFHSNYSLSTGIQNSQLFPFLKVDSEKQDDTFFFNCYKPKYVFSPKIILII